MSHPTGTPAGAAAPAPGRPHALAWLKGHKGPAAAGAGALVVVALAVHARNTAGGTSPAAGGVAGAPDATAGLGIPANTAGLQRRIVHLQNVNERLRSRHAPPAVKGPKPLPKPGAGSYTVRRGDTLAKIAREVYGTSAAWAIRLLQHANPILATFGAGAKLTNYAGSQLHIPRAPAHHEGDPHPKHPRGNDKRRHRGGKHPHEPQQHSTGRGGVRRPKIPRRKHTA